MADETTRDGTQESIDQNGIPEITFEVTRHDTVTQPTDRSLSNDGQPADAKAVGDEIDRIDSDVADLAVDIDNHGNRLDASDAMLGLGEDPSTRTVLLKSEVDDELQTTGYAADAGATGEAIAAAETSAKGYTDTQMAALTQSVNEQLSTGFDNIVDSLFPVGSIYMTTLSAIPEGLTGTGVVWTEILLPVTWQDMEAGSRSYAALGETPPARTVHFFLRTA